MKTNYKLIKDIFSQFELAKMQTIDPGFIFAHLKIGRGSNCVFFATIAQLIQNGCLKVDYNESVYLEEIMRLNFDKIVEVYLFITKRGQELHYCLENDNIYSMADKYPISVVIDAGMKYLSNEAEKLLNITS